MLFMKETIANNQSFDLYSKFKYEQKNWCAANNDISKGIDCLDLLYYVVHSDVFAFILYDFGNYDSHTRTVF